MNRAELLQIAKPILFSADMVRAILDGRKTMTRRVIKPQPKMKLCYVFAGYSKWKWRYPDKNAWELWGKEYVRPSIITKKDDEMHWTPPYHTNDILYVRETWGVYNRHWWESDYFMYRADYPDGATTYLYNDGTVYDLPKWRPSIHMPKEAARIFLRVTDVRVERLKDITTEQAIKEGFDGEPCTCVNGEYISGRYACTDCMGTGWIEPPQVGFMETWNSTIKKSDLVRYGWDANPWCWVIEFERMEVESQDERE